MKFLIQGRGTGKTTKLIHTSEVTGFPIIVITEEQVDYIKNFASQLNCNIPDPMTFHSYMTLGRAFDGVLIDDLEMMLPKIFNYFGVSKVYAATLTYDKEDTR